MRNVGALLLMAALGVASTARADMHTAVSSSCSSNSCTAFGITRTPIVGDVVHYSALVKVGPGEHDMIGIHRVVRENAPWQPKALNTAVFLVHGDTLNFVSSFLVGPDGGSAESAYAVWAAQNNVDVWGIDQRDRVIPPGTIDPGDPASDDFMAGWNMHTQSYDTMLAMALARGVRALTGSPYNKISALGWSRGGQTLYVVAQNESQLPSWARSMKSMTIVDVALKIDPNNTDFIASACSFADNIDAQIAAGIYVDPGGEVLNAAGHLAASDPGGASPFLPGLTNGYVPIFFGGATFLLIPYIPTYHLVASDFQEGFPVSFKHTQYDAFVATLQAIPSYAVLGVQSEGDRVACTDTDLDDHLGDVTIPVYYLGVIGGFGVDGEYTLSLLGSSDITINELDDGSPRLTNVGHDDMFRSRFGGWWEQNLAWVQAH